MRNNCCVVVRALAVEVRGHLVPPVSRRMVPAIQLALYIPVSIDRAEQGPLGH